MTIQAIVDPPGAFVEGMAIPLEDQGKGAGRKEYEEWERNLPDDVEFVVLSSIPISVGFWYRMGFTSARFAADPSMLAKPRTLFP